MAEEVEQGHRDRWNIHQEFIMKTNSAASSTLYVDLQPFLVIQGGKERITS
jgi:hypothetical protein